MTVSDTGNSRAEIMQILKNINDAWKYGRAEDLEKYFHEDMVIVSPGLNKLGAGKRACVDSYIEFTQVAKIHDVRESDYTIDIWGNTAVAGYNFEIDYEMNDKKYHEFCIDLFVFTREQDTWLAVWRTILPMPDSR